MATSHHGSCDRKQEFLMERFHNEVEGIAKREWPDGRVSNEDDGVLSFAITTDLRHQCIRIAFAKPVTWLGLDRESAEQLRDQLTERLLELRGISAT